jgi:hypothetical protein
VNKEVPGKPKRTDLHVLFRQNRAKCYKDAEDYKKCIEDLELAKEESNGENA